MGAGQQDTQDTTGRGARIARRSAAGVAVAGVVGLGLIAIPAGAGAQPVLPPVSPEELVTSVLEADPGAFGGTIELDNALGLPALPGVPQAADGTSTARIWSDGEDRGRVQIPTDDGERTFVADGETFWSWNSEGSVVTRSPRGEHPGGPAEGEGPDLTDPSAAATEAIQALAATSEISVDGTAEVAGRPAYELVLAPAPTERTLLREVRVAVDAEQRVPLRLTVLANGSTDPALQLGFTELDFGPQDESLFGFTPPPGATVEEPGAGEDRGPGGRDHPDALPEGAAPTIVGEGWDTVVVATMPTPGPGVPREAPDGEAPDSWGPPREGGEGLDIASLGTPVSGPWGSGTLISTAVASAIVTDDGRIAAGAVPEQVLSEALGR